MNEELPHIEFSKLGQISKPNGAPKANIYAQKGTEFGYMVGTTRLLEVSYLCLLKTTGNYECVVIPISEIYQIKVYSSEDALKQ